jgi:hypothetical protein
MSEKYREKTLKKMDVQLTSENIPASEEKLQNETRDGKNLKAGSKGRQADSTTLEHGAHTDSIFEGGA